MFLLGGEKISDLYYVSVVKFNLAVIFRLFLVLGLEVVENQFLDVLWQVSDVDIGVLRVILNLVEGGLSLVSLSRAQNLNEVVKFFLLLRRLLFHLVFARDAWGRRLN